VIGWLNYRSARKAAADLASLEARRTELDQKLRQDRVLAQEAARDQARLAADLAARDRASPGGRKPASATAGAPRRPASIPSLLAADPKLFDLYLAAFKAGLAQRFRAQYQAFGLTSDQIQKFEDLAAKNEEERMELQASAEAQGLPMSDPGISAMRQQDVAEFRSGMVQALGTTASQGMSGYFTTQNGEATINGIDFYAVANSAPLSTSQANQLGQLISSQIPQGANANDPRSVNWGAVASQAGSFLNPGQLQALLTQVQLMDVSNQVRQYYAQKAAQP
jgi:hypothetical protein